MFDFFKMSKEEKKEYIADWFGLKSWSRFTWEARILPLFREHIYGYVYDWREGVIKPAYWVRDKRGYIIPWAHFDKSTVMCATMDEWLQHH